MAKYNLIKNGILRYVTSSGIYNKTLTLTDLYKLQDDNTTSSGVVLTTSDSLCLEVDLGQRIKVDGIYLFASDLTKESYINFQYKNYSTDSFIGCTQTTSVTYNAVIPEPSAPRYLRCTVSGIDISLYELSILNNDYIIEFGEGGELIGTWLDDTPVGSPGTPQEIPIFNNSETSDTEANAYICVDSTGSGKDNYIKISKNEEGPYLGFEAGAIVGYEHQDWATGVHNNTVVDVTNNSIKLSNVGSCVIYNKNSICVLPLTMAFYNSIPFGLHSAWDYAADRNKIYAVFWTATDNSSSTLKLYEFDIANNTWTFISTLTSLTAIASDRVYMVYCSGYIYYRSGTTPFYRYNLSGAQNNYEALDDTVQYPSAFQTACSDKVNNVYQVNLSSGYNFIRYTTTTDTWTAGASIILVGTSIFKDSSGATLGTFSTIYRPQLEYDTDHGCVYLILTNSAHRYVQRFVVSTGVWSAQYFDYGSRISTSNSYLRISYYNNKIYFCNDSYGTTCYTYDVATDIVGSFDLGYQFHAGMSPYIITTPPTVSGVGTFSCYSAGIKDDRYTLYGYNTGFEHSSRDVLPITTATGTYTSSIIQMDEALKSSYFVVEGTSSAGTTNISADPSVLNGTVEVRSSNIAPVSIDEIFWSILISSNQRYIIKYDIVSNTLNQNYIFFAGNSVATKSAVDRRTGRIVVLYSASTIQAYFKIFSRNGEVIVTLTSLSLTNATVSLHTFNTGIFFDNYSGFWFYADETSELYHISSSGTTLGRAAAAGKYAHCVDLVSGGAWYTEQASGTLVYIDSLCNTTQIINLYAPYGVCGVEGGGCWVIDRSDIVYGKCIKRYSHLGVLLNVIQTDRDLVKMTHDHKGGFYVSTSDAYGEVWHYTFEGVRDMVVAGLFNITHLRGGRSGVVLYSTILTTVKYISLATGTVLWTKNLSDIHAAAINSEGIPDIFSWDLEAENLFILDYGSNLLPSSNDTVWYGSSNLPWQQVSKDGYFLPKCLYHQIRVTLSNADGLSTPVVKKIAMAPAEKIEGIRPQESKPVFVRSDIPSDASTEQFNARIKVWWDVPST